MSDSEFSDVDISHLFDNKNNMKGGKNKTEKNNDERKISRYSTTKLFKKSSNIISVATIIENTKSFNVNK